MLFLVTERNMAPLLFRRKKGVNLSCASTDLASICTSIDRRSIVRPSRAIDRHMPHLRDSWRVTSLIHLAQPPTRSKSYNQKSRKNAEKQADLTSPGGSSRFLLTDTAFSDAIVDSDTILALPPIEPPRIQTPELRPPSSIRAEDQVVVLRVSLHCKGCEGKIRRHISKMEGVTSFVTDLATKKVTVIGKVNPLSVLDSVSKVKKAEFWSSPPTI